MDHNMKQKMKTVLVFLFWLFYTVHKDLYPDFIHYLIVKIPVGYESQPIPLMIKSLILMKVEKIY